MVTYGAKKEKKERNENRKGGREEDQEKKTYKRSDKVTVLGLVCAKMTKRVILTRQEETDRLVKLEQANVAIIVDNDTGEDQDKEDDEGAADERDIWEVTHVTEEDFETTEGESEDLHEKLMEMSGWTPTVPKV
jgi:hypothetical protein